MWSNSKRVTNSWWHRWTVRKMGRKDGRLGIPPLDSEHPSQYERELIAVGKGHREFIRKTRRDEINRLEGRFNGLVQRLERLVESFADESSRYERKKHELGRDVVIHFSRFWYLIVLSLIGVGELALNFQAFQVFQKPLVLTFVMALAIAIGLPTSAHFIGILVKQWPRPAGKTLVLVLIFVGVGVLCLGGINIARSEYLKLMDVELAAHEEVLQNAFLVINIFVFATAILMSYFAHDSDQDFENVYHRVLHLDRSCHATSNLLLRLAGRIDAGKTEEQAEQKLVEAIMDELVYLYRGENQRERTDAKMPVAFERDPARPTLDELTEIQKMRPMEEVRSILHRWSKLQAGKNVAGTVAQT